MADRRAGSGAACLLLALGAGVLASTVSGCQQRAATYGTATGSTAAIEAAEDPATAETSGVARSGPPPRGPESATEDAATLPKSRVPAPPARKPETAAVPEPEASESDGGDRAEAPDATAAREDEARQEAARPDRPSPTGDPSLQPDGLMGLQPDSLARLLGRPGMIRREAPAEIWQYQAGDCVFDIFLYQEEEVLRVAYFEARDAAGTRQPSEDCLARILEGTAADPAS